MDVCASRDYRAPISDHLAKINEAVPALQSLFSGVGDVAVLGEYVGHSTKQPQCDRSSGTKYQPGDCVLQSAYAPEEQTACDGRHYNLDFYLR